MTNYVEEILNRSKEIHLKKRADYASDPTANPFENFDRSNEIASWFLQYTQALQSLLARRLHDWVVYLLLEKHRITKVLTTRS